MVDVKKIVGAKIKEFRGLARPALSQEALSNRLGVESTTVSRWETGQNLPKTGELEKLAAIFGVPVASLFDVSPGIGNHRELVSTDDLKRLIEDRVGKAPRPSAEEAIAVIAEVIADRNRLSSELDKMSKNASNMSENPKLARLLSAIEKHPSLLDACLNVALGFAAAANDEKARGTTG